MSAPKDPTIGASPSVPKRAKIETMVVGEKRRKLKKKRTPSTQVPKTIPKVEDEEEGEKIEYFPLNKRTRSTRATEEERRSLTQMTPSIP